MKILIVLFCLFFTVPVQAAVTYNYLLGPSPWVTAGNLICAHDSVDYKVKDCGSLTDKQDTLPSMLNGGLWVGSGGPGVPATIEMLEGNITTTRKYLSTIGSGTYSGLPSWEALSKSSVGLSNVDNTSDADKPVSTATQTALNLKQAAPTDGILANYNYLAYFDGSNVFKHLPANNTTTTKFLSQVASGFPSYPQAPAWTTLSKSDVGLGSADDTSDADKPVSTATQTALDLKLDKSSIQNKYLATQFDKINTTVTSPTDLRITIASGKKYLFEAVLFFTADGTSGHRWTVNTPGGGTLTATATRYNITTLCYSSKANVIASEQTALGGEDSEAGCTAGRTLIQGTIYVNAGGEITPKFATKTGTTTASLLVGSYFKVQEIP